MRDAPDGDSPVDAGEVARDERLLREVEGGASPAWFQVGGRLARLRDEVRADEPRYSDPATASLPHARYDDPRWNPIAFLPVPPEPGRRVEYGGATDWSATEPEPDPLAVTAGQEDHSDPWQFAGEDADPPSDTGRPADG